MDPKVAAVVLEAVRTSFDVVHTAGQDLSPRVAQEIVSHLVYAAALMEEHVRPGVGTPEEPPRYPPGQAAAAMALYASAEAEHQRQQLRYVWTRLALARVVLASADLLLTTYYNHHQAPEETRRRMLTAAAEATSAALDAFQAADEALPPVHDPE
jgi:hypothetical protein